MRRLVLAIVIVVIGSPTAGRAEEPHAARAAAARAGTHDTLRVVPARPAGGTSPDPTTLDHPGPPLPAVRASGEIPAERPAARPAERPATMIEGEYRGDGRTVRVSRLFGDIYRLVASDGQEGVGILDGSTYRGVFRYVEPSDARLAGVAGDHLIDWSNVDEVRVHERRIGNDAVFSWTWRWTGSGARTKKPPPPHDPPVPRDPPIVVAPPTGEENPKFGDYVYVEELPEAIVKPEPEYPTDMRGVSGVVLVQALVLKDGTVGDTRIVKSIPMLDDAAVAAVRQWRFKPARSKGQPVAVWVAVPIKFGEP